MNILYLPKAQSDLQYWFDTDKRTLGRIFKLAQEVTRTPYDGSGQPEQLKHHLNKYWSRRIDKEHRLVYCYNEVTEQIEIISCRGHYTDL